MRINVVVPNSLRMANEIVAKEVTSAMKDATLLVEAEAKVVAGFKTGTLARSITSAVFPLGQSVKGITSASAVYAPYVNNGTGLFGPHHQPIVPKTKKFLRWKGEGGYIFARSTKGMKGKHFMEQGYAKAKERVEDRFNDAIKNAVKGMSE